MYGTCKLLSQFTLVSSHKYEGGSQYIMWISKMLVSVDILGSSLEFFMGVLRMTLKRVATRLIGRKLLSIPELSLDIRID